MKKARLEVTFKCARTVYTALSGPTESVKGGLRRVAGAHPLDAPAISLSARQLSCSIPWPISARVDGCARSIIAARGRLSPKCSFAFTVSTHRI